MHFFITVLHVVLSFVLIGIILLQPGKDGASVLGGGGGQQQYGPRGQAHFLGRATTVVAALFMFTSITLAFYGTRRAQAGSGLEDEIRKLEEEEASNRWVPLSEREGADAVAPAEGGATPATGDEANPAEGGNAVPADAAEPTDGG